MASAHGAGRTGRRPGPASSRQAILDASRVQFGRHGFEGATVRAIAAEAGVDPALIGHFFGSKAGLFVAALELPPEARDAVIDAFARPPEEWGERLTRSYLSLWEDPAAAAPLRVIVTSALTNDQARERLLGLVTSEVLDLVIPRLGPDQPDLRLSLAMTHLVGVALGRHLTRASALVALDLDHLVAVVAPTIQHYLTDSLPDPSD